MFIFNQFLIMSTPNIGANTPESAPQWPHKVGAIPGLTKKIMTALAAIGLATSAEKVEGATIIPITGLPTGASYTMSGPSLIGGWAASNTIDTTLIGTQYDSRMFDTTPRLSDTSTDRITVSFSGIGAGTLTITGIMNARTGNIANNSNWKWFSGTNYAITQEVRFGKEGQMSSIIGSLTSIGSGKWWNAGSADFSDAEEWYASGNVNYTFPISWPGTYNLDNIMRRENTTGTVELENFTMNFTSVPEPSTGALVGGVLAAGLLRRRREKETKETQE